MLADILLTKRFGLFNHFLYGDENWLKTTESLDIDAWAERIASTGATRFCLTIMQDHKYMIAPNETFDEIVGIQPGEACSIRDVPMELGKKLSEYGIDLYLYFTGQGPFYETEMGEKFGYDYKEEKVNPVFVKNWAAVLEDYSRRYGSLVKGWWIDGCYPQSGYNDSLLAPYHKACKAGNRDCVVAMNGGAIEDFNQPRKCYSLEEYVCGEYNDFTCVPQSQYVDGAQTHILAPLGIAPDGVVWNSWCRPGLKRNAEYLYDFIRKLEKVPTPLTIDIYVDKKGLFDPDQQRELEKLSNMLEK